MEVKHLRFVTITLAGLVCLIGCGGGGKQQPQIQQGRITGVVSDASSGAAAGVTVSVDGMSYSVRTNANGEFAIEGVPPGVHTVTAIGSGGTQGCAVVVEVEEGNETNAGELVLREAGQISGLVTSAATSEALPDATVTIVEAVVTTEDEMPHPVRIARTNEYGSYTVSGLPVGDYVVTVDKEGYRSASFYTSVLAATTTPGDVCLQPAASGPTGALKGTVYVQEDDGRISPLPGAMVILTDLGEEEPKPLPPVSDGPSAGRSEPVGDEYWAYSGFDGSYSIEGVPPGRYQATAVRPGMGFEQREVAIEAGSTTQADFTLVLVLPVYREITGTVTNALTGEPIAGAEVFAAADFPPVLLSGEARPGRPRGSIIIPDPDKCSMYAVTNDKGAYRLLVPDSVTIIHVYALGFEPAEEVVDERSVIDFKLKPEGGGDYQLPPLGRHPSRLSR